METKSNLSAFLGVGGLALCLFAGLYAGDLPPAASIAAVAAGIACLVAAAVVGSAAGKMHKG